MLYFRGAKKGMVLNKTNGGRIAEMYGPTTENWAGQPVTVWFDPSVEYAGKRTGGLRVLIQQSQAPAAYQPPTESPFSENTAAPTNPPLPKRELVRSQKKKLETRLRKNTGKRLI